VFCTYEKPPHFWSGLSLFLYLLEGLALPSDRVELRELELALNLLLVLTRKDNVLGRA
jgi:hypothetical protein